MRGSGRGLRRLQEGVKRRDEFFAERVARSDHAFLIEQIPGRKALNVVESCNRVFTPLFVPRLNARRVQRCNQVYHCLPDVIDRDCENFKRPVLKPQHGGLQVRNLTQARNSP